jgi:hypothetical protein
VIAARRAKAKMLARLALVLAETVPQKSWREQHPRQLNNPDKSRSPWPIKSDEIQPVR